MLIGTGQEEYKKRASLIRLENLGDQFQEDYQMNKKFMPLSSRHTKIKTYAFNGGAGSMTFRHNL